MKKTITVFLLVILLHLLSFWGLSKEKQNLQLFSGEWLRYAESRVPELYQEVKEGKRGVLIDGEGKKGSEVIDLSGNQKSSLNLQEPKVFDFRRRKFDQLLLKFPER